MASAIMASILHPYPFYNRPTRTESMGWGGSFSNGIRTELLLSRLSRASPRGKQGSRSVARHVTADRLEAHVVDPHLADAGLADDPEVEGHRGGLALGADDLLDLRPAADGLQGLL